ncbi:hypothetical protein J2794_002643 [Paraburkholderia terricola]|nr:hypothetical protein [Paraburkholderia terricola]MDR6446531.1 hypothetical protein [Paraburkholderia terricola]
MTFNGVALAALLDSFARSMRGRRAFVEGGRRAESNLNLAFCRNPAAV